MNTAPGAEVNPGLKSAVVRRQQAFPRVIYATWETGVVAEFIAADMTKGGRAEANVLLAMRADRSAIQPAGPCGNRRDADDGKACRRRKPAEVSDEPERRTHQQAGTEEIEPVTLTLTMPELVGVISADGKIPSLCPGNEFGGGKLHLGARVLWGSGWIHGESIGQFLGISPFPFQCFIAQAGLRIRQSLLLGDRSATDAAEPASAAVKQCFAMWAFEFHTHLL